MTIEEDAVLVRASIDPECDDRVYAALERIVAHVDAVRAVAALRYDTLRKERDELREALGTAQEALKDRPIEGWRKLRDVRKERDELKMVLQGYVDTVDPAVNALKSLRKERDELREALRSIGLNHGNMELR